MFRASSLPIIRSLYCTVGIGNFHAGYDDRFQAESGCGRILILLGSGHLDKQCVWLVIKKQSINKSRTSAVPQQHIH
jgi:hypothetical protein